MPIRAKDPAKRGLRPIVRPSATSRSGAALPIEPRPNPAMPPVSTVAQRRVRRSVVDASPPASPVNEQVLAKPVQINQKKRPHRVVDRTGPNWENGDYLVGKFRPPMRTRWQKGQSGNPRGPKPKEKLDPEAAFEREILAEFTAKINGEEVQLNMGSFVVHLLKANAAKGTVKAQQMLLELFLAAARKSASGEASSEIEAWEQQVIDKMLEEFGLPPSPVFRQTDRTVSDGGQP